jgi:dTDP-glucose pyrophosphorylase
MKPVLLVLAAGMGSRYGGLKQIDPVGPGGETLLDYAVYDAIQAGFGRVVFVIRRDFAEAFQARVAASFGRHVPVEYVYQELGDLPGGRTPPSARTKPWGTAHAVRTAREAIGAPFVVINADDFYGRDAYRQLARFLADAPASRTAAPCEKLAMAGYRLEQTLSEHGTVARGICEVSPAGLLQSVTEHTIIEGTPRGIESRQADGSVVRLAPDAVASMNIWGFTPALFTLMEEQFGIWLDQQAGHLKAEWYIPSVVNTLVQAGRASVQVLPTDSRWFGVTYREDRARTMAAIARQIEAGVYPARLWTADAHRGG